MDAGLIARRYATVLRDFANDRGKIDDVYTDAALVREAMAQQPAAQRFFDSPLHKPSEKRALVEATFQGRVSAEMLQFLVFLVEKERIGYVSSILLVFEMLYKKEHDICTATVTTAKELTADQQQHFVSLISGKLSGAGRRVAAVDATFKVDPAIIGGVILAVDGKQLDDSVQSKLKALERQLTV